MRLAAAEIDRYGPLYDCRPPCREGVTVLTGPNEAGKTLYLEAILQLLDPAVADVMEPPPRVEREPTGRVVVAHGGDRHECPDSALSEFSAIEPAHLQSVFVVRDNDLQLPSEQEYYTSLVEKLGEIHTTEIETITDALKARGRLTDRRLDVSSDQSVDNAGTVRDEAAALAKEIRDYVDRIEADGLDDLAARRLRQKRRLREATADLENQQRARTLSEYERLSEQLETYRETSRALQRLAAFDRDTLEELRGLETGLQRDRDELAEVEAEIADREADIDEVEAELAHVTERQTALERREPAIDEAQRVLENLRDRQKVAAGLQRQLALAKPTSVAAFAGAGVAAGGGAVLDSTPAVAVGLGLLLVGVASGLAAARVLRRQSDLATLRETVLQAARDAGCDVERVEAVPPALESFRAELARANEREVELRQQRTTLSDRLEELETERSELTARIADREGTLDTRLEDAGVDSLEEYEARVAERESLAPERQTARQSLVDRFGDPAADDPATAADDWERQLDDMVADVDRSSVDADRYDERKLRRLQSAVDRLETELADLESTLEDHDARLDAFDDRARSLQTTPFVGHGLELDRRSRAGLTSLAAALEEVVDRIETDAEVSRKAIQVFDRIETREQRKLTELFDPDGPASRTFSRVTDGRYAEVGYDPEAHSLWVERHDGRRIDPSLLSQGTTDQLYFASRVSLAQQLLGTEPGFLLLDDPFLAADPERLRQGFATLQDLGEQGWQILYLTAKREVSRTMVDEFDLSRWELEGLSGSVEP